MPVDALSGIPDRAFSEVAARVGRFYDMQPRGASREHTDAAIDAFCRSFGLNGQSDKRAWTLATVVLTEGDAVPTPERVEAAVLGITIGLQLATECGWSPPTNRGDD